MIKTNRFNLQMTPGQIVGEEGRPALFPLRLVASDVLQSTGRLDLRLKLRERVLAAFISKCSD